MYNDAGLVRRVTNAPAAADGFSTRTVAPTEVTGYRVVEMEARDVAWQTARYASCLAAVYDVGRFEAMLPTLRQIESLKRGSKRREQV